MSIQSTIETVASSLSPSLARVAEAVGENPGIVLDSTINELAAQCDTSVASVVRFCRSIGLSGYAQLRMELAAELGKESAQFGHSMRYGTDLDADAPLRETASRIASLEILAIEETIARLDFEALEQVVSLVAGSSRVLLYGIGASHYVAQDLCHKLLRIGRNAYAISDPHEARASAALPIPDTVAIAFSHLGETRETVEFLRAAQASGAFTVALTSAKESTLTSIARCALFTEVRETALRAGATVSRIAQLAVIDALFAGVAQRNYAQTVEALRVTREATRSARGV